MIFCASSRARTRASSAWAAAAAVSRSTRLDVSLLAKSWKSIVTREGSERRPANPTPAEFARAHAEIVGRSARAADDSVSRFTEDVAALKGPPHERRDFAIVVGRP